MFLLRRNYAGSIHPPVGGFIEVVRQIMKMCEMMETAIANKKNKGGRPPKADKRSQQLAVMCTADERKQIEAKAKACNVSVSEFLRTIALQGQIDRKTKVLPKEVLFFTAILNHLAANINQIAKKRNQNDELNAIERANLDILSTQIKELATEIKNYLQ
jgi:hypothetical protein